MVLKASQGALWIQPRGPNTKVEYLGCHGLDGVTIPLGDMDALYQPDPARAGMFKVSGMTRGTPGLATTTIDEVAEAVASYLEKATRVGCPVTVFAHKVTCHRRDLFTGYDRSLVLEDAVITQREVGGWVARNPGGEGESTQSYEISAKAVFDIFRLTSATVGVGVSDKITAVALLGETLCGDECGSVRFPCETLVVAENPDTGAAAKVYYSTDGGDTWTLAGASPFAVDKVIGALSIFRIGRDQVRILAARGTAAAGNPAEVAYSDDFGTSWTSVDVGSTSGQYVPGPNAMLVYDPWHIWLATNDGYVYLSEDGGLSWTAQEEGDITVSAIHSLSFHTPNTGVFGGASNVVAITEDGGASWTALSTPLAKAGVTVAALAMVTDDRIWVLYADGDLYYSEDMGVTWSERTVGALSVGVSLGFVRPLVGFVAGEGLLYRTIDGGYTWELVALPTSIGNVMDMVLCDENTVFVSSTAGTSLSKVFAR